MIDKGLFVMGLQIRALVFIGFLLFAPSLALAKTVDIALIRDGPADSFLPLQQVKKEINTLLEGEFQVRYIETSQTDADWTLEGVNRVLQKIYNDKSVDIVITLGPVASNEVAKINRVTTPTIAATIINPNAQRLPYQNNKSGRNNFTYIADVDAGGEIEFFKGFTGKTKIAVLIEPFLSNSWEELDNVLAEGEKAFGINFTKVPLTKDLNQVRKSIPADTQAAMVGILSQHSEREIKDLANLLVEMKLPSYTFLGEKGVDLGFMVTEGQLDQERFQIARRIALDVQRILFGRNAKDLPIDINFSRRVVFNESTALKTGFSPNWQKIINAKILHRDELTNRRAFSVTQAITFAIENNLNLKVNSINVDLAAKDIAIAKSNLYPTASLGASYQQIKKSTAFIGNPERRADASLSLSQPLYSENLWANYDVSEYLFDSQNQLHQAAILDTAQLAASAYLGLLSAKANEEIQLANLELTEKNLQLAQNRMRIGTTGKSDVLRFQSQIATNRQNLFSAVAARQNAELDLARVMNLPEGLLVDVREPDVASLLSILTDARFQSYVNNQIQWNAFQEFYKREAIANAPELKSFDAQLSATERNIIANQRGYYIPNINLTAQAGRNISQSGIGSVDNAEKNSWTVGIGATLPLDLNGQRRKNINRTELQKEQLDITRLATQQQIVSNTGKALFTIGSSYPNIQLSQEAAKAASESLELVQDSYAKGAVSISDLLDAQNNALSARLSAINAEYNFLQDYMSLMRSAGDFTPILKGKYSSDWFNRLHKYFTEKGIEVDPR